MATCIHKLGGQFTKNLKENNEWDGQENKSKSKSKNIKIKKILRESMCVVLHMDKLQDTHLLHEITTPIVAHAEAELRDA